MEQKDPNTISGLLKLHLRENGLLSSESMKVLSPHLESKDEVCPYLSYIPSSLVCHSSLPPSQEALVDTALECLPTKELQPLLEVVSLLATIVEEPWKQNNKMNPRTLGIACGLSVFPDLDPGRPRPSCGAALTSIMHAEIYICPPCSPAVAEYMYYMLCCCR